MGWISRDGKLVLLSRGIRSFGYGFLSVILAIYLKSLGFDNIAVGLILSASVIGGGAFTLLGGRYAAAQGIRRMLMATAALGIAGVAVFIFSENYLFLLSASLIAFISPSGRELGPFLSLEQAYLPTTVSDKDRTKAFSYWNMTATLSASAGALLGSAPIFLQQAGFGGPESFKAMLVLYLALNVCALAAYSRLKEVRYEGRQAKLGPESRRRIAGLAALFSIDSLGGGLVLTSVVSLWFFTRFDTPLSSLSVLFSAAGLLEAFSYYISGKLAARFGLINTMVFTHLPSSVFLILIPFMPSFTLAAAFYLCRQALSEMDVPARQSYVVAIVSQGESAIAASATNVAKIAASSVGPVVAGALLLSPVQPFAIAGGIKIAYDILLYTSYRRVKPSEEAP